MVGKERKQEKTKIKYMEMCVLSLCSHDTNSFLVWGDWNDCLIWMIKVPTATYFLCTNYNETSSISKLPPSLALHPVFALHRSQAFWHKQNIHSRDWGWWWGVGRGSERCLIKAFFTHKYTSSICGSSAFLAHFPVASTLISKGIIL